MDHLDRHGCRWLHVLLKGEQTSNDPPSDDRRSDDYVEEFAARSMTAKCIPILKFEFKNLESLKDALIAPEEPSRIDEEVGLILTSPRAVESVRRALDGNVFNRSEVLKRLKQELTFVVGQQTGMECQRKLNLSWNLNSGSSGAGVELAEYIKSLCRKRAGPVRLIYPKSSLADRTIEEALSSERTRIKLVSVIAYETSPVEGLHQHILGGLRSFVWSPRVILQGCKRLILNLVFFSPSGVEGFSKLDLDSLLTDLWSSGNCEWSRPTIELRFSSIGRTTEAALRGSGFEVFAVAEKPSARSLVDNILVGWRKLAEPSAGVV